MNNGTGQPALLVGSGVFLPRAALDSFPAPAQDHSYTNKVPQGFADRL
jgi:hypothetical protein